MITIFLKCYDNWITILSSNVMLRVSYHRRTGNFKAQTGIPLRKPEKHKPRYFVFKKIVIPKIHWSKEWEGGEQERNGRGGRPEGEEKRQLEGRSDAKIFYTIYTISYLYQWAKINWCPETEAKSESLMGRSTCYSSPPSSPGGPIEDLEFGTFGRLLQKSTTNSKFRPLGLNWDVFGTISSNSS